MALNSKPTLRTDINTQFATQHLNLITAADLRDITTDIVDSMYHETGGIPMSGVTGVVGSFPGDGVNITESDGTTTMKFLKFGRGFKLTPDDDGSVLIEFTGTL